MDWRPLLRKYWPAAVLILIPCWMVLSALGPGQFLHGSDAIGGYYHLHGAVGKALAEGRLPFWDPHAMAGAPLLAALHAAVLYPPTWIAAVLSPGWSWTLGMLLHLVLAGLFTLLWLRRGLGLGREAAFVGALLFQMSAFLTAHVFLGHLAHVSTVPWAPALLWRLERFLGGPSLPRALLLAVCLAMMLLAGHPQFVMITGIAVVARLAHYVLAERDGRMPRAKTAAKAAGSMGLALLLAAPQLLPTLELISQGQRASIDSQDFAASFSAKPSTLLTVLVPGFFGDDRQVPVWGEGAVWESPVFVGLTGLGLAALGLLGRGRQRWLWAGLALASLPLAFGHYTPVFPALARIIPGVALFRVPARYLFLFTLGMAPLAALGAERLRSGDDRLRRDLAGIAAVSVLVALIGGGFWLSLRGSGSPPGWWAPLQGAAEPARRALSSAGLGLLALSAVVLGAALLVRRAGVCRPEHAVLAFTLLLAGELWLHESRYYIGHPVEGMAWPPEFETNVRSHPRFPFRIATVTPQQIDAIGKCQLAGLDHVGGYDPMMLRRYTELVNVGRGKPARTFIGAMALSRPGPLFDLLGARYWIVPGPRQEPPGWKTIGQVESGFVYENPAALPRAFFVGRSVNLVDADDRLKFLSSPDFDARKVVVTERDSGGLADGDAGGTVQLERMEPGRYSLVTESASAGFLVLAEAWYPGWRVEVNGIANELLIADHLLQAVRLPPGRHQVTFRYRSRTFGVGIAIAVVTAIASLALLLVRRHRRELALQRLPGAP